MPAFAPTAYHACDDLSDLAGVDTVVPYSSPVRAPYVAPVPPGFVPLYTRQREALLADLGFLAAVAPDLFAWRVSGTSVAAHHATGKTQEIAADQGAARKARRHREYCDGLRVRPVAEAVARLYL